MTSPPIARVVAVLNFLGGHAGQSFTLTEIAKSLHISGATCHSLLGALSDAGYVYRTAAKCYVIGPAISRLAQTQLTLDSLMQVVREHRRSILVSMGLACGATVSFYVVLVNMPTFAHKNLGLPLDQVLMVQMFAVALMTVVIPLSGLLSDRLGRRMQPVNFPASIARFAIPQVAKHPRRRNRNFR